MLVDSCFDRSDSKAVGHENGDEPVRLDAGDVGNDDGREVEATLNLVMPWLGSAQLSSAKHGSTKMGQAKPSHS